VNTMCDCVFHPVKLGSTRRVKRQISSASEKLVNF
jgi:hypothetical protein